MRKSQNLMEGLLEEIIRVEELKKVYLSLPRNAGLFAARLMTVKIIKAKSALATMDTVQMIAMYKELKEYES